MRVQPLSEALGHLEVKERRAGSNWPDKLALVALVLVLVASLGFIWLYLQSPENQAPDPGLTLAPQKARALIADAQLLHAYELAYHYNRDWRKVADLATAQGVALHWGDMSHGHLGEFHPSTNTAVISNRLRSQSADLIAPIVAHELYHGVYFRDTKTLEDRLQHEIDAIRWEVSVWRRVPKPIFRISPVAMRWDTSASHERAGTLDRFVVDNWREHFFGGLKG